MRFFNPTFHEGINITVRRGGKEYVNETEFGNYVYSHESDPIGFMHIEFCWQMRFVDIENEDIERQHDAQCRNIDGLYNRMTQLYPGFDAREIVTILAFKFTPFAENYVFSSLS